MHKLLVVTIRTQVTSRDLAPLSSSLGPPSNSLDLSYHTPTAEDKAKFSASIKLGTYDAGAHVLRTCSLPDLNSLAGQREVESPVWDSGCPLGSAEGIPGSSHNQEEEVEPASGDPVSSEEVPRSSANQEEADPLISAGQEGAEGPGNSESSASQMEEGASNAELHNGEGEFYDDVAIAASFPEGEEGEEEEGEDWSSSEDEDLQQLVQTLQNFVEEASGLQLPHLDKQDNGCCFPQNLLSTLTFLPCLEPQIHHLHL